MVWLKSPKSQLSKTFSRLKICWIWRKLWAKMCVYVLCPSLMSLTYIALQPVSVFDLSLTFSTCFNIHSVWWYGWKVLSLSFSKLWKSVEYEESYEQRCLRPFWASFNTFNIHSITALIVYIELLLTPLTYPLISISLYPFCLYNCTYINRMKPLPQYVHTVASSFSNSK